MPITSLKNTFWKFNSTVSMPNKELVICSRTKSNISWQVEFMYADGTWNNEDIMYSNASSPTIEDGGMYRSACIDNTRLCLYIEPSHSYGAYMLQNNYIRFSSNENQSPTNNDLIQWLEENATLVSYNNISTIKYSDSCICDTPASVTIPCAGKKAKTDIEMHFADSGKITYDGKTIEVEAGKTATLHCAGKKMRTDVDRLVGNTFQLKVPKGTNLRNHTKGMTHICQDNSANIYVRYGDILQLTTDNEEGIRLLSSAGYPLPLQFNTTSNTPVLYSRDYFETYTDSFILNPYSSYQVKDFWFSIVR